MKTTTEDASGSRLGELSAVPAEVLKLIPRTYREWALLSLASKALAERLGDYHETRGYTFHDGATLEARLLTYN